MKSYKKIYFKHFGYGEQDIILCENCNRVAVDIHHLIFKSHCGTDDVDNLIALCRVCHNSAHNNFEFNNKLKEIVKNRC